MNNFNTVIRNSAKAIIIRNDCLLLVRISDESGEWHVLPGGGQKPGESLHETVRRECLESIGVEVEVGELRLTRKKFSTLHCRWIGDMVQANASAIRTRLRRNGCEFDFATPW